MAPLTLVARPGLMSILRVVSKRAVSHLQMALAVLVPCGRNMIFAGLFGEGEDNIRA